MHKKASPSSRVVELDALRGIAALAVVAFHYTTHYGQQYGHTDPLGFGFTPGNYGVNLFFLISGFVIFMTLERTRTAMDFVVSRFSRLFPAYWVAMLLTMAVVYTIGMPDQHLPLRDLLLNFSMVQQILGAEHLDGSYWTLQVELFFYAQMLLWFALGLLKRIHLIILLWLGLAIGYGEVVIHHMHFSYLGRELLILRHIPFFALGILFYRLHTRPDENLLNYAMIALSLVAIGIAYPIVYLWVALGCCGIFLLFVNGMLGWMRGAFFVFLGSISYSLYLLHQAIGFALIHAMEQRGMPSLVACVATLVIVVALAALLTFTVERPAMRKIRSWWRANSLQLKSA
ncbi:acyltransferase [Pseudoxanthomonas sp. CF125]|uniref:acyltransferase family protein n=1 Tax=Pseudoxanthomonas sp. CF125 TaxID=1855303 RepID=UPI00088F00C5|nr:acyltransferase [Pseudoxanthomonas sp. CF125]SDQ41324.1 Peptidoglycan/LPS O-acetylase OafA/YrhL, contains acyltransferase and SGNH-hydrolase domains [Pseudoxanthomonas sp. CF125]